MRGSGVPPWAVPVGGGSPRTRFVQSPFHQVLCSGFDAFPPSPEESAQLSPNPLVQFFKKSLHFGETKVVHPAAQYWREFLGEPLEVSAPAVPEQHPEFGLETFHTLGRDFKSRLMVERHAVPQKLPVPRTVHGTLFRVDPEFETFVEVPGQRSQYAFPRLLGPHVNVAVIGVTAERVAAPLQFLVQVVQQDVGQQWRCGVPSVRCATSPSSMMPA